MPGEQYVVSLQVTAPQSKGKQTSFFRFMFGPDKINFGQKVWIEINVDPSKNQAVPLYQADDREEIEKLQKEMGAQ